MHMELHNNLCILPSNERETAGEDSPRVLRNTSGNVGYGLLDDQSPASKGSSSHDPPNTTQVTYDDAPNFAIENALRLEQRRKDHHRRRHAQKAALRLNANASCAALSPPLPPPLHNHQCLFPPTGLAAAASHRCIFPADEFASIDLYHPNRSFKHPILTAAEMRSPKYLAYRNRARKDVGKDGKVIWSNEIEDVFQEALRVIPPMGRKKDDRMNGKPSGRNELVADYIFRVTGEKRKRKQVSSHIQVLAGIMKDNGDWMALVRMKEDIKTKQESQPSNEYFTTALPVPATTLGSTSSSPSPSIRAVEFEMWISQVRNDGNQTKPAHQAFHTYTALQSEIGSAPAPLEDLRDWRSAYPSLARDIEEDRVNSELILFETNFRLMDTLPTKGSALTIHFYVHVARSAEYKDWGFNTSYYEDGEEVKSRSAPLEPSESSDASSVKLEIPLGSCWWAQHFTHLAKRKLAREGKTRQEEDAYAHHYLQAISIMQEIWATPKGSDNRQRIAVFLWKFREAGVHESPTTAWRKVIPPPLRMETNSPDPSPSEHSSIQWRHPIALDPAIHDTMGAPSTLNYTEYPQTSTLFAEDAHSFVASGSEEDTLIADPSHPYLPSNSNMLISQGLEYPSPSSSHSLQYPSFAPSTSSLPAQSSAYASHDASCRSFSNVNSQCTTESASQDFTGGHINLAYETSPNAYESHFMIPQTQMLKDEQHQYQELLTYERQMQQTHMQFEAAEYHGMAHTEDVFAHIDMLQQDFEMRDMINPPAVQPIAGNGQVLGEVVKEEDEKEEKEKFIPDMTLDIHDWQIEMLTRGEHDVGGTDEMGF